MTTHPGRPRPRWIAVALSALAGALVLGVMTGPVPIGVDAIARALLDAVPGVAVDSGLSPTQRTILFELRLPRVALGALVGATLATAGAAYQGVFRNPLADPYLLGAAAGAGLGATLAIAYGPDTSSWPIDLVPLAAFAGALVAVMGAYGLGRTASGGGATLILAGVAVAAFLTALQTFVLQREDDTIRRVYAWILGRLSTSGWGEVTLLLPYAAVCITAVFLHRRHLDVLRVGEEEATTLGIDLGRVRLIVVLAASLGTAAAVAVSGLIGFVGLVVPHLVRLVAGSSYRTVVPLSVAVGAAFLVVVDVAARTVVAPGELPIGVVTAFFGAPFFALVLITSRRTPA